MAQQMNKDVVLAFLHDSSLLKAGLIIETETVFKTFTAFTNMN